MNVYFSCPFENMNYVCSFKQLATILFCAIRGHVTVYSSRQTTRLGYVNFLNMV